MRLLDTERYRTWAARADEAIAGIQEMKTEMLEPEETRRVPIVGGLPRGFRQRPQLVDTLLREVNRKQALETERQVLGGLGAAGALLGGSLGGSLSGIPDLPETSETERLRRRVRTLQRRIMTLEERIDELESNE